MEYAQFAFDLIGIILPVALVGGKVYELIDSRVTSCDLIYLFR